MIDKIAKEELSCFDAIHVEATTKQPCQKAMARGHLVPARRSAHALPQTSIEAASGHAHETRYVIPAKAGIHLGLETTLDSRFRGNDMEVCHGCVETFTAVTTMSATSAMPTTHTAPNPRS